MAKELKQYLKNGTFGNVSKKRSKMMRAVKGQGNKTTERRFRSALISSGSRGWIVRPRDIVGKPDFYFPALQIAVFVDGCFWHGCPKCGHVPKTNTRFWRAKIQKNQSRDKKITNELKGQGIAVLRFWEHEILSDLKNCTSQLVQKL